MAIISSPTFSNPIIHFPPSSFTTQSSGLSVSRNRFCRPSVSSMDSGEELRAKFMDFPYASAPIRNLMVELLSSVETHLGSSLHPDCTLPPDVQHFGNPTGSAYASLHLRSGLPSSQIIASQLMSQSNPQILWKKKNVYQIDFMLGGWIHCKLPSGGALNITSLSAYLRPSTDAPHFLLDLIQSSPSSLVLVLDLTPRKDLILYPRYLKTYYEETELEKHRQCLYMLPEVRPYFSPSLYVRSLLSPTAIIVSIDTGESENIEEIVKDQVSRVSKELLQFWIESCACSERRVGASETAYLAERDQIIKNTTIEVDLGASFPKLFGQEVANRVLNVLKENYNK